MEEFDEVEVRVPSELAGSGGRMLLRHGGRDLQLDLPPGYDAGELVRIEVPAESGRESDSGESGLSIEDSLGSSERARVEAHAPAKAGGACAPLVGQEDAVASQGSEGGATGAEQDRTRVHGAQAAGETAPRPLQGGMAQAPVVEESDGEDGLGSLSESDGFDLDLADMTAHAAVAAARMQRVYRGRVARRKLERAAMEELFPSESPLAAIFDETGQMTTTARTFVSAIEDGKHGLLISFTDPTLVQRVTVEVMGGSMRPVFRTFRQPFSLRAAEGQRALLLHSELPSALIGERPAEASHQSSEEDGAASHLGAMHPGFEPPPFDEHPDVPREKPVSEQQLPTSRSQARRVAQSPPTGQGLAREVEIKLHFLPYFQQTPSIISLRLDFSHTSEPCQYSTTLRNPDGVPSEAITPGTYTAGTGNAAPLLVINAGSGVGSTAVEERCAVRMQRKWRWYASSSKRGLLMPKAERSRRSHAAIVIQSAFRGSVAKRRAREIERAHHEAGVAGWGLLRPLPLTNDFTVKTDAAAHTTGGMVTSSKGVAGFANLNALAAGSELVESHVEAIARRKQQHEQPRSTRHSSQRSEPDAREAAQDPPSIDHAQVTDGSSGDEAVKTSVAVAVAVAAARLEERKRRRALSLSFRALLVCRAAGVESTRGVRMHKITATTDVRQVVPSQSSKRVDPNGLPSTAPRDTAALRIQAAHRRRLANDGWLQRGTPNDLRLRVPSAERFRTQPRPRGRTTVRRAIGKSLGRQSLQAEESSAGQSSTLSGVTVLDEVAIREEKLLRARQTASARAIQRQQREKSKAAAAKAKVEAEAIRHRRASTLQGGWRGHSERRLVADAQILRSASRLTSASACASALRGLTAGRALKVLSWLGDSAAQAKQRAIQAEDFDRAKRYKQMADGLVAHAVELRRAELERSRAAAAQEYETAITQREKIESIKLGAARLLAKANASPGSGPNKSPADLGTPEAPLSCGDESRDTVSSLRNQSRCNGSPTPSAGPLSPKHGSGRFDRLVVQTNSPGSSPLVSAKPSPHRGGNSFAHPGRPSPFGSTSAMQAWPSALDGDVIMIGTEATHAGLASPAPPTPSGGTADRVPKSFPLVHAKDITEPSILSMQSSLTSSARMPPSERPLPPSVVAADAEAAAAAAAELAVAMAASDEALLSGTALPPAERSALQPIILTFGEFTALRLASGRPALVQAALLQACGQLGSPSLLAIRGEAFAALELLLRRCLVSSNPQVVLTALRLLRLALDSTFCRSNASLTGRMMHAIVPAVVSRAVTPTRTSFLGEDSELTLDAGAEALAAAIGWIVALSQVGGARVCASLLIPPPEEDASDMVVEMKLSILLAILQSVGCASAAGVSRAITTPPPVPLSPAALYVCAAYRSRPRLRTNAATLARQLHTCVMRSRRDVSMLSAALRRHAPELHEICFGVAARPPRTLTAELPSEQEACAALRTRIAIARTKTDELRSRLLAVRAATQRVADARTRAARHAADEVEGTSPIVLALRAKLDAAQRARDAINEKERKLKRQRVRARPTDLLVLEKACKLDTQIVDDQVKKRRSALAAKTEANQGRQIRAAADVEKLRQRQRTLLEQIDKAKRVVEETRAETERLQAALKN